MKRAREALEQGNTKFVARGENKKVFEEMKRKFEEEKNAQSEPDSKKVKLPAAAPEAESSSSDYSPSSDSENEPSPSNTESAAESAAETEADEEIKELRDDAHFVAVIIKWFDCKKKHKKVLIQGIKNALSEIAPLIYKSKTTQLSDKDLACPGLNKFFDQYDISDFGSYFSIARDAYNPTLCKVTWIWTKPAEPRQQVKQIDDVDPEAAMAWMAEMQRKEAAWKAYMKSTEANRVHCMAGDKPVMHVPSGHYKGHMFDEDLAQGRAEHDKIKKRYENEARERAMLLEVASLAQQD